MTTLAEMRAEVATERGWHLDDDGDRIDAELNERFSAVALELYDALESAKIFVDDRYEPGIDSDYHLKCEIDAVLAKARAEA